MRVGGRSRAGAGSEPVGVAGRAAQLETERGGERGPATPAFGDGCAPVSRRTVVRTARARSGRLAQTSRAVNRAGRYAAAFVEPGTDAPEPLVPLGVVPDHGRRSCSRPGARRPRRAERGAPHRGGHDGVDGVLGQRFDGRGRDGGRVEGGGVAADEGGKDAAG